MAQKSTSIAELQQEDQVDLQNIIQEVEQDPQQQQQMYEQPPQQQEMPQQQQMMMPPPQMMMPPPIMKQQPASMMDSLVGELKDALIVALVVILINFEPVSNGLTGVFSKVSENPMIQMVLKGAVAGVAFYAVKKLVLNK